MKYRHTSKGHVVVYMPEHPRASANGAVFEHIIIWENAHNQSIKDGYCIHHINGIKDDNRPENLICMPIGEHTRLHHKGSKRSIETKKKQSEKAKERFKNKENHPFYKDIDINEMISFRKNGHTVQEVCQKYEICRRTFYNKINEYEREKHVK